MRIKGKIARRSLLGLLAVSIVLTAGPSLAACVKRSLTEGESAFYAKAAEAVQTAFPAPEGWSRNVHLQKTPKTVCEGSEDKPLQYYGQIKFKEITEADRIREEMALKQKALDEKILDASSRGDIFEMNRLQGDMQKLSEENLEALKKLQELQTTGPKPDEMLMKFNVNEPRRVVGKKFEIPVLQGTKISFERVNSPGTERETVTKMLYVGGWRVEDFKKNYNLFRPEAPYDRVGGVRVHLTGKRGTVEPYIAGRADLGALGASTDQ